MISVLAAIAGNPQAAELAQANVARAREERQKNREAQSREEDRTIAFVSARSEFGRWLSDGDYAVASYCYKSIWEDRDEFGDHAYYRNVCTNRTLAVFYRCRTSESSKIYVAYAEPMAEEVLTCDRYERVRVANISFNAVEDPSYGEWIDRVKAAD